MGVLGDIVLGLGNTYLQNRYPTQTVPYPTFVSQPVAGPGGGALIPFEGDLVAPGYGEPGQACGRMVYDPKANCGAGKWLKKTRRRRKRLATTSDIKDLAALKAVLGGGKAFDTWIASRGR